MDFDDVLKAVGQFGKYQKIKYLLVCLVSVSCALQTFVSILIIATPDHRCSLPEGVLNSTDTWQNHSAAHSALVDLYIPVDADGMMDSCHIYSSSLSPDGNRTKVKCDSWVYDTSERDETIVTKFGLVCDRKFTSTLLTSLHMFGSLAGSFVCGIVSDMLGRRKAVLIGIIGECVAGVVLAFSPDIYSVGIFRFIMGVATSLMFLPAFVMGIEIVGPNYRVVTGVLIEIAYAIGFCLLVPIGYALKDILSLQLAITLPSLLFISYYWFLPESARWLLVRGRVEEATEIIHSIAETNGTEVPADMTLAVEEYREPERLSQLRHAPRLLGRSLIVFFNWLVVAMSYYGLSLNSGNMPGSLYVNMMLSAGAELIGQCLCLICIKAGRKWPHVASMSVGGLACMASVAVYYYFEGDDESKNWTFIALNQVGKLGVTIGFTIIYFWCAEIFPTGLRNSLTGFSSAIARIGSIIAPYLADIGNLITPQYSQMLPPLIFGVLTLAGGLLSIGLPETTGYDLPETIAEANEFPKSKKSDSSKREDNSELNVIA